MTKTAAFTVHETAAHDITRDELKNPERLQAFGSLILRACLHRQDLYRTVSDCVGYDALTQQGGTDDFTDPLQSLLFAGLQEFEKVWIPGHPWPDGCVAWARALSPHYQRFFEQNPEYPDAYIPKVIEYMLSLSRKIGPGDLDRLGDGLVDYVLGVRYLKAEQRLSYLDPARRREEIERIHKSISIPGAEAKVVTPESLLESIFAVSLGTKPFYTGISTFDHHYGRKALGGDAWLFYGLPGGGKTNLACQTAANTALNGGNVMYVTTEVRAPTLMMRCCSSVTGMSYSALRGMMGSGMNHPSAVEFSNWVREGPGKRIQIYDYRDTPGREYREKLERMLDSFYAANGEPPSLIVWDWIGSSLDQSYADAWQKREAYNGVANKMAMLADDLDIKTLTLAQGSKETKNRVNLAMSDTQDSKSLADPMEGVVGITALMDNTEGSAGDQNVYRENQFLVVCKCREEEALRLAVVRDFAYARFKALC